MMGWEIFDAHADEYDNWFDSQRGVFLAELARIREFYSRPGPLTIEIGAGSGRFSRALGVGLGIEPSPALARMARNRGVEVIRARAENLPIRTGSFSVVLLITVICYLEDPCLAFYECHRILKPGGLLIVAFIERGGLVHQKYFHSPGKHRFLSRACFYSQEEVIGFLRRAAFRVKRIESRAGFCIVAAEKID